MDDHSQPTFIDRLFRRVSGSPLPETPEQWQNLLHQAVERGALDADTAQRLT